MNDKYDKLALLLSADKIERLIISIRKMDKILDKNKYILPIEFQVAYNEMMDIVNDKSPYTINCSTERNINE